MFTVLIIIAKCEDISSDSNADEGSGLETRSVHLTKRKEASDLYTNKKIYLKRFAQSWKYYAKANDIAKREKLRKALLDALKSMNNKKKTAVTSLTRDSVQRIQHAARMLREFKRMYMLSNDVISSWKDYDSARKSLLDIGKTKEGGDILKKYVILRDKVTDQIKRRSEIPRPTIVDDQDIDENVAKDNIARQGQALKSGGLIVQKAMTPGTLQIIRSPPKHSRVAAYKRMELLSDAKEAARTAYSKAKEAIQTLKERLKGMATQHGKKPELEHSSEANETNDKGTNKKSILAENNNEKGESLGHVNAEMALAGMIKKAEKTDLDNMNEHIGTNDKPTTPGAQHSATNVAVNKVDATKAVNEPIKANINGVPEKEQPATQTIGTKVGLTASISSLMDSLAGEEEASEKLANNPSKLTENSTKTTNKESSNGNNTTLSNVSPLTTGVNLNRDPSKPDAQDLSNNSTTAKNVTDTSNMATQSIGPQDGTFSKIALLSSQTAQQTVVKVSRTPLMNEADHEGTPQPQEPASNVTKASPVAGSKRFHLNEDKLQEQVVKTIDRQLETLKRLQDAKRARRRYDSAKHELQEKIKKLYDMAVSFEKPINAALVSTKTNIDPGPVKNDHPGAALAGISDKPGTVVKTPSDDNEHHGFTLGAMDSKALSKAHIVDLNEESNEQSIEKDYQVDLSKTDAASKKSVNEDRALKSLTEAIKNDLRKIELNQREQAKARKHSEDIKHALEPLITEMTDVKLKSKTTQSSIEKSATEASSQALGDKKDKQEDKPSEVKEETAAKAQDAFKEVEDYLSKALKHVAKEAISEEAASDKDADFKEASDIINEGVSEKAKSNSPTTSVKGTMPTAKASGKVDDKENEEKDSSEKKEAKESKENDKEDRNERLRKIVEDAMKEHAKDPKNPHPINADLLKPTTKVKTEETTAKAVAESKKDEKSSPTESASAPADATVQRSPNDAIGKAEHLEEQVAQLQDKLYNQGTSQLSTNDAYKTIDNVEDKPLFSQDANPGDPPTYQDPIHHHSHRRHHHPFQDEEEDDRAGYEREYDDDDDDDGDYDDDDDDQREDYDDEDEEDRKRKKSFLQPVSWRKPYYRNYQRDKISNKELRSPSQQQQQPLMNTGMMGDEERDELEDTKKSSVPRAKGKENHVTITGNKMYIL